MSNETGAVVYTAESIIIGLCYSATALGIAIAYIPCLLVIARDKELNKHSCMKMMKHLGYSDMINLLQHFVIGLLILLYPKQNIPYLINKIFVGTTSTYAWHTYIILCLTIAVNRLLSFCRPVWEQKLFNETTTKFWIGFAWFNGFLIHVAQMSPKLSYIYYPTTYNMYLDFTTDWGPMYHLIGWWEGTIIMTSALTCYVVLVIWMKFTHKNMTVVTDERVKERAKKEKLVLKQAAAICLYCVFLNQFWSLLSYLPFHIPYSYQFANWLWIMNSGINPIIYLTLNKTISEKVRSFQWTKSNQVGPSHAGTSKHNKSKLANRSVHHHGLGQNHYVVE